MEAGKIKIKYTVQCINKAKEMRNGQMKHPKP